MLVLQVLLTDVEHRALGGKAFCQGCDLCMIMPLLEQSSVRMLACFLDLIQALSQDAVVEVKLGRLLGLSEHVRDER